MAYSLRLIEDRLAAGAAAPAAARAPRALRGLGRAPGRRGGRAGARGRAPPIAPRAPAPRAPCVYRVELVRQPPPAAGGRVLLEHPIDLAGGAGWLMRCDRVDFEPGGVAPPHRHRGGGIRCLLRGRLEVTVAEGAPRTVAAGRGLVRERARAGARGVGRRERDQLHPLLDPARRDPRAELHPLRGSRRRRRAAARAATPSTWTSRSRSEPIAHPHPERQLRIRPRGGRAQPGRRLRGARRPRGGGRSLPRARAPGLRAREPRGLLLAAAPRARRCGRSPTASATAWGRSRRSPSA